MSPSVMSEASAGETRLAGDWDHLEAPSLIPSILAGCPEGWSQLGPLTPCLPATPRVTQVSSRLGSLGVVRPLTLRIRAPKLSGLYDPVLWAEHTCLPNFTGHLPGLNGWSGGGPVTLENQSHSWGSVAAAGFSPLFLTQGSPIPRVLPGGLTFSFVF